MSKTICIWAVMFAMLPVATLAQVARNGNEYDFRDNQPTAAVDSKERNAGVAPSATYRENETDELQNLNKTLQQRAQHDAQASPGAAQNPFGVQPGGVVHTQGNVAGSR